VITILRRVWRGFALAYALFGHYVTGALVLLVGLFLWASLSDHPITSFVLGAILALLVIRAHDMGYDEPYRTEFDAYWLGSQWTPEQRAQLEAQKAAPHDMNKLDADRADTLGRRSGHDV
jgi:hypothetical protein